MNKLKKSNVIYPNNTFFRWLGTHPIERAAVCRLSYPDFMSQYPEAPCQSSSVYHLAKDKVLATTIKAVTPKLVTQLDLPNINNPSEPSQAKAVQLDKQNERSDPPDMTAVNKAVKDLDLASEQLRIAMRVLGLPKFVVSL